MKDVAELQINDVAFGGKGVARLNGKTIFVPYTIDGETVTAHITREQKRFSEAELETVIDPSPYRAEPRCPYFGRCGGCVYQHMDYEHQLQLKSEQVGQTLRRIGGLSDVPLRSIVPSPLQYAYRNRITVHARDGLIGYFRRESNQLIDVEHCPIAVDAVNAQLAELRANQPREGHYTLRAHSGPRTFVQANDAVAAFLLELVERSAPASGHLLIDAYGGAGFFAKRLRHRFRQVIGIDWDRNAIREAQRNSEPHERYFAGPVEEELPRLLAECASMRPMLIVDPPAAGLAERVRRALLAHPPARLIYVSCHPGTLARDLASLREFFRCVAVTPLDMFPQTAEIEVVAELLPTQTPAPAL